VSIERAENRIQQSSASRKSMTFEMTTPEGTVRRELPFIIGVMADLSGHPGKYSPGLLERKFLEINRDNFESVLASVAPRLLLEVPNRLGTGESRMKVELYFKALSDFEPWAVARRIPVLWERLMNRGELRGRQPEPGLNQVGGLLEQILQQTETRSPQTNRASSADEMISNQLDEIIHAPEFQALEATWRGLWFLVSNIESSPILKVRVLDISKRLLLHDLQKAVSYDQTIAFKRVHDDEYGVIGGSPYGVLIGDYEFSNHPEDMKILEEMAAIAATINAPFVAAASPRLFGCEEFAGLLERGSLGKIFEGVAYARWRSFRASGASRYVGLVLPRVLYRIPYGRSNESVRGLDYEENAAAWDRPAYLWGNAAYVFAARLAAAFSAHGICTEIRGLRGGGLVTELTVATSAASQGPIAPPGPTEISLSEGPARELSGLGFLPLAHDPEAGWTAFLETRSCCKPALYARPEATIDARLAADLRCVLAISRFVLYVKVITLEIAHRTSSLENCVELLGRWLKQSVRPTGEIGSESAAIAPLREARIEIIRTPGQVGVRQIALLLLPNLGEEKLTSPIRLVVDVPGLR